MVAKESKHYSAARDCPVKICGVLIWGPGPVIGYLHRCSVIAVRTTKGG